MESGKYFSHPQILKFTKRLSIFVDELPMTKCYLEGRRPGKIPQVFKSAENLESLSQNMKGEP